MIDPNKFGTAAEVAAAVKVARTTLISAVARGEIETVETCGGTVLVSVASASKWAKQARKVGPKFKADKSGERQ